jgi:hypothetical protein
MVLDLEDGAHTSLLSGAREPNEVETTKPDSSLSKYGIVGGGFALMLLIGVVVSNKSSMTTNTEPLTTFVSTESLSSLRSVHMNTFAATNKEIQNYGPSGGDYPWMDGFLIEPYSKTTFYSKSGYTGEWDIEGEYLDDSDLPTTGSGVSSFNFVFKHVGKYTISFKNSVTSEIELVNIYIRYVRREIKSLDEGKRTAFKNAFIKVIEIRDEVTGKALYGDSFTPFAKLAGLHTNWAGSKDCDHLHDGMGFVTSHVQMSRILEESLQAVDPSVSLPYWEYTKDVEHINTEHNGDFRYWKNIYMFSDEYFGATDANTAQISSGDFHMISMEADPKYSTVVNSYGLMRAPWNNLGNPKVTRYFGGGGASTTEVVGDIVTASTGMSSCSNLYDFITKSTDMYTFTSNAEGLVHGPIHLLTGGVAGTPELINLAKNELGVDALYPEFSDVWTEVVQFFIIVSRAIYRNDLLVVPEIGSCEVGVTSEEDCACTCDATEVIKTLRDTTLTTYLYTSYFTDKQLQTLVNYYCTGGIVLGDHASASAASDPSFFSIHGTLERYLQLLRLTEKFTDETWPPREECLFSTSVHAFSDTCSGHYKDDMLLFGKVDGQTFTNIEYYNYLDPKKGELSYIYDHFEFDHCTELGYDIKAAAQKT